MAENNKTFTQEQVNEIIAKEREKMQEEQSKSIKEREQAILKREMRMNAIDKLQERGLPANLVDALNYSDEKALNTGIDILAANQANTDHAQKHSTYYTPKGGIESKTDPIRKAMGL